MLPPIILRFVVRYRITFKKVVLYLKIIKGVDFMTTYVVLTLGIISKLVIFIYLKLIFIKLASLINKD